MFTGALCGLLARAYSRVDLIGERGNLDSLEFTMAGYRAVNVASPGRIVDGVGGVWVPKLHQLGGAHRPHRRDERELCASGNTMNLEKTGGTANWEFVAGLRTAAMSEQYGRITIPENAGRRRT